jgi:hypothetical protein
MHLKHHCRVVIHICKIAGSDCHVMSALCECINFTSVELIGAEIAKKRELVSVKIHEFQRKYEESSVLGMI